MNTHNMNNTVEQLGKALLAKKWTLATAESCTGGLISSTLTDTPGSSAWFAGGVVAYANQVKRRLLGVAADTLQAYGAVSEATVQQMAQGVCRLCKANMAVAVSGVAGPGGGAPEKPVGTVWIAWAMCAGDDIAVTADQYQFSGDRIAIKRQTAEAAITGTLDLLAAKQAGESG